MIQLEKFIWRGEDANVSQCLICKHWQKNKQCRAFSDIPLVIRTNEHDHSQPYPGDNGIRFEPLEATNAN